MEVLSLASSSKGVWDLSKPLTVDNSDGYAVYQIIPSNSGKYTLNCGLGLYGNLYTESGERIEEFYEEYSGTIRTTLETGQTYYLYIEKPKQYANYKIVAQLGIDSEIVEIRAYARKTQYTTFEDVLASDFYTEIEYSDGRVSTVYDNTYEWIGEKNTKIVYKVRSADGTEEYIDSWIELDEGEYTVIPELTEWIEEEPVAQGVNIRVKSIDISELKEIKLGETVRLYGNQMRRFLFIPEQAGMYDVPHNHNSVWVNFYRYNEEYGTWSSIDEEESKLIAGTKYLIEAKPMKAEQTLSSEFSIIRTGDGDIEDDSKPELGSTSEGGILNFGWHDLVIGEPGDTVSYTFTPERTGCYRLYSTVGSAFVDDKYVGNADSEVYLYQGDTELAHSGEESGAAFSLDYRLEAGTTYTYKVQMRNPKAIGTFSICLTSGIITGLELREEDDAEEYGVPDFSSMSIRVNYSDKNWSWEYLPDEVEETFIDEFGNEFQYNVEMRKEAQGNRVYHIYIRYREFDSQKWTVVTKEIRRKSFTDEAEANLLGTLKGEKPQTGTRSGYYRVVVEESGLYQAKLQSSDERISCSSFFENADKKIYREYLGAGRIYYVKVDVGDAEEIPYTITVSLQKNETAVTDIEIIEKPEYLYRVLEQATSTTLDSAEPRLKVKVTYANGDSVLSVRDEYGDCKLPNGRSVSFEYTQIDNQTIQITASLDGCTGIAYVPLREPGSAPLMPKTAEEYAYQAQISLSGRRAKGVLRVSAEKTGLYQLTAEGVSEQKNAYIDVYNDALYKVASNPTSRHPSVIWEMEAGREYYITIQNMNITPLNLNVHLKYQGVSSHVCEWKEDTVLTPPTCETDGLCEERCSICDSVRERKIPALGHQFAEGWQRVEPTCIADGYEKQVCDRCGKMVVRNYVSALGHDFSGAWITDVPAEAGKEGSQHKDCARDCGEKIIEIIPALPRKEVVNKVEEINASVGNIELPQEGGTLTEDEIIAVDEAVKALTDIGSETLLNNVPDVVDTMEKLEGLAVAADDKLADTIVSKDAASGVALSKITGASITAAVLAKDKEIQGGLAEGELLGARVQVERSAREDAYESLGKTTVAVDISLDLVKQNTDGAVIGTVKENVTLKAPMQVTLNVPQSFADKEFALYHITAGGNVKINYTRNDDGTITFTTPSLSDFVFALTDCGEGKHGETKKTITIDPTCSQPGRQEEICQTCGKAVGEPTVIQPIEHSYTVEENRIEPDCKNGKDGSIVWKCKWCTQTRTEIIPAAHEWNVIKTVAPTCAQEGYTLRKCMKCSTEEKINKVPATGKHTLTVKVDKQATCGAAGSQHKECTVCGYKEADTAIPATGKHTLTVKVDKQPTCGTAGSQHKECTVCGYKEADMAIPATNRHSFGAYAETKEATALSEGTMIRSCTVCGMTESKETAKLQATISVNTNKILLKTKQKTSAFTVSGMAKGDYVKAIVSSKDSVVKVSGVTPDGHCKLKAGKKKGSAKLTVTLASGLTKTVKVKVQTAAVQTTAIKEVPKKLNLKVKKSVVLNPVLSPITSTDKIKYSTSNKKVATVTSKGVVKGKKKGKAKITITAGKKKIVCTVIVKK